MKVNQPNKDVEEWGTTDPDKKAKFGVLEQLGGTWINYNANEDSNLGLHTISMPSGGTNSEFMPGLYHFVCENYTEELTFKLVPDGVRNRGGYNEQYVGAIEYNQAITNTDGKGIHEENGMYMYLGDMYTHAVDEKTMKDDLGEVFTPGLKLGDKSQQFLPHYNICRSGTIPHGNSIQLLGRDYLPEAGKPAFPEGDATWDDDRLSIHPSMAVIMADDKPIGPHNLDTDRPEWVGKEEGKSARKYIERIFAHDLYPYAVRPDIRLREAIKDQNMKEFTFIDMGTRFAATPNGGVLNTPLVARYCPVTEMKMRLWIETVIEDGEEILQLQYEQIVFFEFSNFVDGSMTRWPHIMVNTLRKKDWVEAQK